MECPKIVEPHVRASNVRYIAFPLRTGQSFEEFVPAENELYEEFAERWMGMHHISQSGG